MTTQLMAVNENWLSGTDMVTNNSLTVGNCVPMSTSCGDYAYTWPPTTYYYPVYQSSPARPIKLTLSEVERLRNAAKADERLKAILQKFTAQIEITVDFE